MPDPSARAPYKLYVPCQRTTSYGYGKGQNCSIPLLAECRRLLLPGSPAAIYAAGKQAHVPLLAGWNADEEDYTAFFKKAQATKENYAAKVHAEYGKHADEILKLYPGSSEKEMKASARDLARTNSSYIPPGSGLTCNWQPGHPLCIVISSGRLLRRRLANLIAAPTIRLNRVCLRDPRLEASALDGR